MMARWKVVETRDDLVTIEKQGHAGMISMPPPVLGLTSGHQAALGALVVGDEDVGFTLDPAPHPQSDPGDETHGG